MMKIRFVKLASDNFEVTVFMIDANGWLKSVWHHLLFWRKLFVKLFV